MAVASAQTLNGDARDDRDILMCDVVFRLGFYNIGWQYANKRRGIRELRQEVLSLVMDHQVQVLCLCEVFDIEDGLNEEIQVATQLVQHLNSATSAGTWGGASCHHYVTLWRKDLGFTCVAEHSFWCRVETRDWQRGQYLRFVHADWPQPINVVHNHSVSSDKRGKLTSKMRSTIAQTGWDIVCRADSAAQPVAVFGGDYNCTPLEWYSVIRGMHGTKSMRRREQLCVSRLIEEGGLAQLHGDDALAINCVALHEASRYGNSFRARGVSNNGFSDNHDLVLVPMFFDNTSLVRSQSAVAAPQDKRKRKSSQTSLASTSIFSGSAPMPTPPLRLQRVPCQGKALAIGASCREEEEEDASVELTRDDSSDTPSTQRRKNHRLYDQHLVHLEQGLGQSLAEAENSVPDGSVLGAAWFLEARGSGGGGAGGVSRSEVVEEEAEEAWTHFTDVASMVVEHHPELAGALEHIANVFLFDGGRGEGFKHIVYLEGQGYHKLAKMFGISPANKWKRLLIITRRRYVAAVRSRPWARGSQSLSLSDKEMCDVINAWRHDPGSWLRNVDKLNDLKARDCKGSKQAVHQFLKQSFSTYLMELCGCKPLVSALIQSPLHVSRDPIMWCHAFLQALVV